MSDLCSVEDVEATFPDGALPESISDEYVEAKIAQVSSFIEGYLGITYGEGSGMLSDYFNSNGRIYVGGRGITEITEILAGPAGATAWGEWDGLDFIKGGPRFSPVHVTYEYTNPVPEALKNMTAQVVADLCEAGTNSQDEADLSRITVGPVTHVFRDSGSAGFVAQLEHSILVRIKAAARDTSPQAKHQSALDW